ncbi:hypothetical protein [Nonomuraea jiangxiensis]|uniref:hypothetical protein n=1 Tax=Nonomuraea jiangxiensis TaxID=633440 RepID=UPI000B888166|nr:hypothetical protein [Nonomuraea jiangxiensis]
MLPAPTITSLPYLSLEPVFRRSWGSLYDAPTHGRIDAGRVRPTRLERRPPTTAHDWGEHLAALTDQLHKGGTLALRHWDHSKLYKALAEDLRMLDQAHPGGLDELASRR